MRNLLIYVAAAGILIGGVAHAQQADPNRRAYGYALRCFAVAGGIITDPRSTPAEVTNARASSRRAFDAGVRLGRLLGLSGQRISDDMDATGRAEAALNVRDAAYFQQRRAECARLGL